MGKEERKLQILESAARLFSSRRFDEVLMDEIAREAGVAKGTVYSYFPDKEELYFAVVFDGISRLNDQLQEKADTPTAPELRLREMLSALVSFLRQNRFFFRLMSIEDSRSETGRGANRQRWHEERHRQQAAIEAVLRSGAAAGVFVFQDLAIEARILRDMVRSVLQSSGGRLSSEEVVDIIMKVFLDGVRARP